MEKVPHKAHSRKIKKQVLLLIPACIAILCLALLYLLMHTQPLPPLPESDPPLYLFSRSAHDIQSIQITNAPDAAFTLVKDGDGQMHLLGLDNVSLREDVVSSVLSVLDHLEAEEVLEFHEEEVPNLSDFGLDAPCLIVSVQYSDGDVCTMLVGSEAPSFVSSYYCRIEGVETLYLINADLCFPLFSEKDYFRAFRQPALDSSLLDRIEIHGELSLILAYTPSGWLMESPNQYPANKIKVQSLLRRIESMAFECCLGTEAEVDMAALGLDNPALSICLTQAPTIVSGLDENWESLSVDLPAHDYILHIGNETGASGVYLEWEGSIYKASNFLLGFWKELNPDDYLLQSPINFLVNDLCALTVRTKYAEKQYDIQLVESITDNNRIATDEYGQTLYDVMITRHADGQVLEANGFLEWYLQLSTLAPSGKLSDWAGTSDAPLVSILLETGSLTREISFYAYNPIFSVMSIDGTALYYVDTTWVDKVLCAP